MEPHRDLQLRCRQSARWDVVVELKVSGSNPDGVANVQ
jgi:hypothetical protein